MWFAVGVTYVIHRIDERDFLGGDVGILNEYESSEKAIPWIVLRWTAVWNMCQ
jgi:hypothetical protein